MHSNVMATGFSLSKSGGSAVVGNPMSRSSNGKRSRRRRQQQQRLDEEKRGLRLFVISVIILATLFYSWDADATHDEEGELWEENDAARRKQWEEGLPLQQSRLMQKSERRNRRQNAMRNTGKESSAVGAPSSPQRQSIHTAPIDTAIRYLTKLAQLPPDQLWDMLGMDDANSYGDDPFSLGALEKGQCPWAATSDITTVDWLIPRPYNSEDIAQTYRNNMERLFNGRVRPRKEMEEYDAENEVAIWYEHLSKAGGTTFCGLAGANMKYWQVPKYHCMPRKGELLDGRVGTWPNDELVDYLREERHGIVSNEWEPLSLEKLELSGRQLHGPQSSTTNKYSPQLLFITTLRDPSDRLLSAYTFFALTTTENRRQERGKDGPTFNQWIQNMSNRAGKKNAFRANTARYNHITWRFSGGSLTHSRQPEESEWKAPFETAIRALSQQDLILPMDVMTKDGLGKAALQRLLGWKQFEARDRGRKTKSEQLVTIGGIKNSNAREYFSKEEYQQLWEENWLDNILYLWSRAVFLARLHCKDVLADA